MPISRLGIGGREEVARPGCSGGLRCLALAMRGSAGALGGEVGWVVGWVPPSSGDGRGVFGVLVLGWGCVILVT